MMITIAEWLVVAAFVVAGIWQFFWIFLLDRKIQQWDDAERAKLDAKLLEAQCYMEDEDGEV